ncbi:MAG: nucleoside recognition domain-containing protein [Paludibacter sp.]|nr:nucleoside recognition domain-containing protein [Paludibacter sp.]
MKLIYRRLLSSALSALPKAKKTVWWLLKIILPTSLLVSLLHYFGILEWMSGYLTPLFSVIGLPGESAIVFISSIFLPLYAPIAIIATLPLNMREITILALMCLISHNMIIESAIQKKTGSSYAAMFTVRIISSFVGAYLLNLMLPDHMGIAQNISSSVVHEDFISWFTKWAIGAWWLIIKIVLIITGLMMLQNILKTFNILDYLAKTFAPVMRIFGLSKESSFLWFIGQTIGLTYGSAVMIEQVENNDISREDANLLNYHIAVNHSLLEDTLLFVAIGVPASWLIGPRFILAIIIVWTVRYIIHRTKNI